MAKGEARSPEEKDMSVEAAFARLEELLKRLEGTADKDRTARFVCAVAAILPSGKEVTVRETMEGRIAHDIAGANGFGYDPIFFLPEFKGIQHLEIDLRIRLSLHDLVAAEDILEPVINAHLLQAMLSQFTARGSRHGYAVSLIIQIIQQFRHPRH